LTTPAAAPEPKPAETVSERYLRHIRNAVVILVIASLALGVAAYVTSLINAQRVIQLQRTTTNLQRDTNDNLCNQQEYSGGTICEGGNGGSGGF
jgi:hypothetical protein